MIGALTRAIDNFLGRGEAAVTVPPLDGALRPNNALDEAKTRIALEDVDCLAVRGGKVLASAGDTIYAIAADGKKKKHYEADREIVCIEPVDGGGLAVALITGEIVIVGGRHDGDRYRAGDDVACITALAFDGGSLYVTNGSATNGPYHWQRDLMEMNASGSLWRIDLTGAKAERVAGGLAWPAGIAVSGDALVVSEAWKHRLVRFAASGGSKAVAVYQDLPGYPGRISRGTDGWWLAVFAPRSQLVEFVLREPVYRKRMLNEIEQEYWVSPKLRSGRSFYEPLQGGGVKHLGLLKPWAPTMSAGLCVHLDKAFQPVASLQSRADGATHGITSVVENSGQVFVAARGDGLVVKLSANAGGGAA